jgi:predicted ester cyclase
MDHAVSTLEENKALVRRFLERAQAGWSDEVMKEFFAPGYRRHLTPTTVPLTPAGQQARAGLLREAFPDAAATLDDLVAEGDRVVFRLTIRGIHRGPFREIPPTGRHVTVSFLGVVRISDGKFVEEWGGLDLYDLRQQLQA